MQIHIYIYMYINIIRGEGASQGSIVLEGGVVRHAIYLNWYAEHSQGKNGITGRYHQQILRNGEGLKRDKVFCFLFSIFFTVIFCGEKNTLTSESFELEYFKIKDYDINNKKESVDNFSL